MSHQIWQDIQIFELARTFAAWFSFTRVSALGGFTVAKSS
jgi:hypothetical protein